MHALPFSLLLCAGNEPALLRQWMTWPTCVRLSFSPCLGGRPSPTRRKQRYGDRTWSPHSFAIVYTDFYARTRVIQSAKRTNGTSLVPSEKFSTYCLDLGRIAEAKICR